MTNKIQPKAKNNALNKLLANNKRFVVLSMLVAVAIIAFAGDKLTRDSSAASGNQYCTTGLGVECLNAWGGGPWVYTYGSRATSNDDFVVHYDSSIGHSYIQYTGGGKWNNQCIGDSHNSPIENATSLDPCPNGSNTGGWGTNFNTSPCSNSTGYYFYNVHNKGYLAPALYNSNGAEFLLGNSTPVCFKIY
jgi:hypothetical protein